MVEIANVFPVGARDCCSRRFMRFSIRERQRVFGFEINLFFIYLSKLKEMPFHRIQSFRKPVVPAFALFDLGQNLSCSFSVKDLRKGNSRGIAAGGFVWSRYESENVSASLLFAGCTNLNANF